MLSTATRDALDLRVRFVRFPPPQSIAIRRPDLGARCQICGRLLGVEADPLSADCGGDCWGCVGELEADGWAPSARKVAKEVAEGWRNPDGSPKPPRE